MNNPNSAMPQKIRANRSPPFSDRQIHIIQQVADGFADKQIAESLDISEETVAFHLRRLFEHFEVPSRAALVAKAIHAGVISNRSVRHYPNV